VYVYLRETISPAAGFLWGWAMFWSIHSGIIAAIAVVLARYAGYFAPLGDQGIRAVAMAAILGLSIVNYMGVKSGSAVQAVLTAAKLVAIAGFVALAFALGTPAPAASIDAPPPAVHGFLLALGACLFAFGGWHMVTYAAGETREAARTIPRSLWIGTLVVSACYFGLNAAYVYLLPLEQVVRSTRVAADAAGTFAGPRTAAAISALIIVSALGALNGIILAGPRVYYAMAQDGLWFRSMGAIHPVFRTPHMAIAVQAVWSCVLVATGTYRVLFSRVIYTEWLFFALMTIGLLRVRKKSGAAMIVPALFVAACAIIAFNQLAADPFDSVFGLLVVGAGLPVYFYWSRKNRSHANH
jgi:APA family basic amino acid/polyamine antiporter